MRERCCTLQRTCFGTRGLAGPREILPPWQIERCQKLQVACLAVKARLARGEKLLRSIRIVAGCFNGRTFKSDLSRRFKLSASTLTRLYYTWKNAGEKIEVFRSGHRRRYSLFTSLVIARFADHILAHPQWSIETTWKKFSSHRSNFRGSWRPAKSAIQAAMKKAKEIETRVKETAAFQN